jgi:rare lipoprotein A
MRFSIAAFLLCSLTVPVQAEDCIASMYGIGDPSQPGTETASGIPLNDDAMTAAHKSLPFLSKVRVTNKTNGNSVTLTIMDRGPFVTGRCIDVTKAGARSLGISRLAQVSVVLAVD